jgi:hypothetical protein
VRDDNPLSLLPQPTSPGLAFDILPPLRLGIGVGDERWNIHIIREILHPPRRRAGFKDDALDIFLRKLLANTCGLVATVRNCVSPMRGKCL